MSEFQHCQQQPLNRRLYTSRHPDFLLKNLNQQMVPAPPTLHALTPDKVLHFVLPID
jgi:hypothetical protein